MITNGNHWRSQLQLFSVVTIERSDRQLVLVWRRGHNRSTETLMGEYTYLVGLVIWGVILGTIGLVAASRERRSHGNRPTA